MTGRDSNRKFFAVAVIGGIIIGPAYIGLMRG
jgi:hypothetical protein